MTALRDYKPLFTSKLTEAHLFSEVGKIIASELMPAALLRRIVEAIGRSIRFDDASVYAAGSDLTRLTPLYFRSPALQGKLDDTLYYDNGAPGVIASSGEPLFFARSGSSEMFLHHPDEEQSVVSYVGIPLKNDVRVVGVMGFSRSADRPFTVEEFDLLRTISPTISAGLEKAQLFVKTLESARTDELTGLANYRVLLEKLQEEMSRQVRTGREFSFVMIDIDNFKRVNDRYGHLEGSRVLSQLGALLRDLFRTGSTDVCFRYGGEEFSILLGETAIDQAGLVAERVRRSIEDYPFTLKALHPHEVLTVSMGVSRMLKEDRKAAPDLIAEADIALYHAKSRGKNQVVQFEPGLTMPGPDPNAPASRS